MTDSHTPTVVAGFGRSGTTWVQDVLAESNSLRPIFEPLHPKLIRGAGNFAHRYFDATHKNDELYQLLHQFFYEEFFSLWSDYRIVKRRLCPTPRDLTSWHQLKGTLRYIVDSKDNIARFHPQRRNQQRIIKFVRANMMLSWLHENFHARMVFVVRHPAPVVISQMMSPSSWNLNERFDIYRNDQRLLSVLDKQAKELLFRPLEPFEALTLSWCIENGIGLAQARQKGIHTVFYEYLLEDSEPAWKTIVSSLELSVVPDQSLIGRPSQQAWGEKAANARLVRQYDAWIKQIDKATASKMQRILDATGMTIYSLNDPLPTAASE
jgi:hypothetical protein